MKFLDLGTPKGRRAAAKACGQRAIVAAATSPAGPDDSAMRERERMADEVRRFAGMPTLSELRAAAKELQDAETARRATTSQRIAAAVRKVLASQMKEYKAAEDLSDEQIQTIAQEIVQRELDQALLALDTTIL